MLDLIIESNYPLYQMLRPAGRCCGVASGAEGSVVVVMGVAIAVVGAIAKFLVRTS